VPGFEESADAQVVADATIESGETRNRSSSSAPGPRCERSIRICRWERICCISWRKGKRKLHIIATFYLIFFGSAVSSIRDVYPASSAARCRRSGRSAWQSCRHGGGGRGLATATTGR
jgi:hypothetical protein